MGDDSVKTNNGNQAQAMTVDSWVPREERDSREDLTKSLVAFFGIQDSPALQEHVAKVVRWQKDSDQLREFLGYVRESEDEIGSGCGGSAKDQLAHVVRHHRDTALQGLSAAKQSIDDLIVWMRSMVLVLEMVGNASTHKEKDARLRGAVELAESAITRLRNVEFDFRWSRYRHPDLFKSDYPIRDMTERLHRAQDQIKELEAELGKKQSQPVIVTAEDDQPF